MPGASALDPINLSDMNLRVIALMSSQRGLVTRQQAIDAGMSTDQIDRLVRTKTWSAVRKGVYAETQYVGGLTTRREERLLRDRAASLRIRSSHVLTHHSSAYMLGLDVLHEHPQARTHVTRPGIVGSHQRHGVTHHRAPYDEHQIVTLDGVPCLDAARTACDISRDQGYLSGRVAAESALRTGTSRSQLDAASKGMTNWPNVTVVRDANASASPDTDSVGETLAAELVTSLGFGVPFHQFGLTADGRTAWCDLRIDRHIFEFDGKVKYMRIDEGGLASTSANDVVWFEKKRQDWICGFKLGMSRLTWDDAFAIVVGGPLLDRVQGQLRREYLETCQRFGTDITNLAAYRPRGTRPRPGTSIRIVA